jgi:hypothetical protein
LVLIIVSLQEPGQNQLALMMKDLALHLKNGRGLAKLKITSPVTSEQPLLFDLLSFIFENAVTFKDAASSLNSYVLKNAHFYV